MLLKNKRIKFIMPSTGNTELYFNSDNIVLLAFTCQHVNAKILHFVKLDNISELRSPLFSEQTHITVLGLLRSLEYWSLLIGNLLLKNEYTKYIIKAILMITPLIAFIKFKLSSISRL